MVAKAEYPNGDGRVKATPASVANLPKDTVNITLSGNGVIGEEALTELVEQLNRRGLSRQLRMS